MADKKADVEVLLPILRQIPIFASLDETDHHEIIEQIILMYYPEDYTIFNEGDQGDALYILKSGAVQVFHPAKEPGELPKKVAEINQGGFFGEMALVSAEPRNASIQTLIASEVFILKKEDFDKLLNTNTHLAEQISATMVNRINENDSNKQQ